LRETTGKNINLRAVDRCCGNSGNCGNSSHPGWHN